VLARSHALVCLALVCLPALGAAQTPTRTDAPHAVHPAARIATRAPGPSRYLYVWAGPQDTADSKYMDHVPRAGSQSDFLAVIDLQPADTRAQEPYGRVISTVPVGAYHTMPHHGEQAFAPGRNWFVSGFMSGQLFLFDAADRAHPRYVTRVDSMPGFRQPHSLARLRNGHVIATVQFGPDAVKGRPGGIVELDDSGRVVRTASSADPAFPGASLRTYGLAVALALDRIVTTSSPMDDERVADVIQVWRLSDFRLLRTIPLSSRPDSANREPFEARVLSDGRSVLVNTYRCGFYRLMGLETLAPSAEFVLSEQPPKGPVNGCSVPVVVGHYWVMPIAYQHRVAVLDVSRPEHPREVSSLATDSTFFPHWSSADPQSDRIVVTEQGDGLPRVMIARLDQNTGQLNWDERFRDAGSASPGLNFGRPTWPNGAAGAAMPHAAIFVPEH
jgi:hypothetical protein